MNISTKVEGYEEVRSLITAMGPQAKNANRMWVNMLGVSMQREMQAELPSRFHLRGTSEGFKKAVARIVRKSQEAM